MLAAGVVEDALVVVLVERDDAGGAEVVLGGAAGGGGHGFEAGGVAEEVDGGGGHAFDVADLEEKAVDAVVDELGDAAYAGGDGGDAAGHGFEGGEAEGLHLAGHEHEVGEREELVDVVLLAEEVDAVGDAVSHGEVLGGGAVGAVADEHAGGRAWRAATRAKTSTTSMTRLTGRKLERWTRRLFVGLGEAGAHAVDVRSGCGCRRRS